MYQEGNTVIEQSSNGKRVVVMGVTGTILFELLMASAPIIGAPVLNVALWDGSLLTLNLRFATIVGFGLEILFGILLAYVYQNWVVGRLKGSYWQKGTVFGIVLWLLLMVFGLPLFDRVSPLVNNGLMLAPGVFARHFGAKTAIIFLVAMWGFGLSLSYLNENPTRLPYG